MMTQKPVGVELVDSLMHLFSFHLDRLRRPLHVHHRRPRIPYMLDACPCCGDQLLHRAEVASQPK
eukprot:224138-Pyramimonas_sp.AAC.1